MARKAFGITSLAVIAMAAIVLMVVTFLGTATGVIAGGTASAFGARVSLTTPVLGTNLLGPLPNVTADITNPNPAEASLLDVALAPLIEVGVLKANASVDRLGETVRASSDTAHIGLLKTTSLPVPVLGGGGAGGGGLLGGILPTGPLVGGPIHLGGGIDLGSNIISITPGVTQNAVDVDALHGVVSLNCAQLASLRTASTASRLGSITRGSSVAKVELLGSAVNVLDSPSVTGLTPDAGFNERSAAARVTILPTDILGLSIPAPLSGLIGLVEVTIYDVQGNNLTAPNLTSATVKAQVDMLRVRVFDKLGISLAADIRIGHAEGSLTNCVATPPPTITTPPPTVCVGVCLPPLRFTVDVTKAVESINGSAVLSQANLSAARGQDIEYSLTTFNRSLPGSCSITRVVDFLPDNTTFVSSAGDLGAGRFDATTNTVTFDNLAIPGGIARRQGMVIRINGDAPSGTYVNRYTATGTCGTFTAVAPGINVTVPAATQVLGTQFRQPTPNTGVSDTAFLVVGALMAFGALGTTKLMRRGA